MIDERYLRCNTPRPDLINETVIRGFCEPFHDFAATAVEVKSAAGKLGPNEPGVIYCMLLMNYPDGGKQTYSRRYEIGEHKRMADDAIYWSQRGYNFYVRASLFGNDLVQGAHPTEEDVTQVLALVADYDGKGALLPGLTPSFNVHTSAKNRQHWFLMNAPYLVAYPLGVSLRQATGMDSKTGVTNQPYRLPGTPNYPTRRKVEDEDRDAAPTCVLICSGHFHSVEQLQSLLPPCDALPPSLLPRVPQNRSTETIEEIDAKLRAYWHKAPGMLAEPTGRFYPKWNGEPDRSNQFLTVMRQAIRAEIPPEDFIKLVFFKYPTGCARKYLADENGRGRWLSEAVAWNRLAKVVSDTWERGAPHKEHVGGVTFGGSLCPERHAGGGQRI